MIEAGPKIREKGRPKKVLPRKFVRLRGQLFSRKTRRPGGREECGKFGQESTRLFEMHCQQPHTDTGGSEKVPLRPRVRHPAGKKPCPPDTEWRPRLREEKKKKQVLRILKRKVRPEPAGRPLPWTKGIRIKLNTLLRGSPRLNKGDYQ